MNIQTFSKCTGLSAYTIRYYEKIGLLKNISRNSSGHRCFDEKELAWAGFIARLKETGMSLECIAQYAQLREQGSQTSKQRMLMLEAHAINLDKQIQQSQLHLKKLQQKIHYYSEIID